MGVRSGSSWSWWQSVSKTWRSKSSNVGRQATEFMWNVNLREQGRPQSLGNHFLRSYIGWNRPDHGGYKAISLGLDDPPWGLEQMEKVEGIYQLRSGESHLRSEEHTSELQSHLNLVCRLLLEKKKTTVPARY